jgi:hypothetical protein
MCQGNVPGVKLRMDLWNRARTSFLAALAVFGVAFGVGIENNGFIRSAGTGGRFGATSGPGLGLCAPKLGREAGSLFGNL